MCYIREVGLIIQVNNVAAGWPGQQCGCIREVGLIITGQQCGCIREVGLIITGQQCGCIREVGLIIQVNNVAELA